MSHSSHTILCGSCKAPAKSVANPKADDKVTCSRCGREDRFDNVMRSVKEYVGHCATESIRDVFADSFRGSKGITYKRQSAPQRSFRWITTDLGI